MNNITLLGVDLAKNKFQLCGYDKDENRCLTMALTRSKFIDFMVKLPPCIVAMESCGSSNYWARKFMGFGHEVKLINPKFVKPYVKTNKNDFNDAEAICEAASRKNMRFVTPKSVEQQDIQSIHRIRTRFIQQRTALVNQARGLLAEYGIIIGQGINNFRSTITEILEDAENGLRFIIRECLNEAYKELVSIDERISNYDNKINNILENSAACKRIEKIPGIGPMTATAIVACIGEKAEGFENGRHLSAYFGLVPRQSSSGNKINLLGISKRGNSHMRTLLIHGARSVMIRANKKEDRNSKWVTALKERTGFNKAAVALANKNARIIWALLAKDQEYKQAV